MKRRFVFVILALCAACQPPSHYSETSQYPTNTTPTPAGQRSTVVWDQGRREHDDIRTFMRALKEQGR